jgi:hypothetical protein
MKPLFTLSLGASISAAASTLSKNTAMAALIVLGTPAAGAGFVVAVVHARSNALADAESTHSDNGRRAIDMLSEANFSNGVRSALLIGPQLVAKGRRAPAKDLVVKIDRLIKTGAAKADDDEVVDQVRALRELRGKLIQVATRIDGPR